jgi:hypothetical protein
LEFPLVGGCVSAFWTFFPPPPPPWVMFICLRGGYGWLNFIDSNAANIAFEY